MSPKRDPLRAPTAIGGPGAGRLVMLAMDRAGERLEGLPMAPGAGGLTRTQIDRVDLAPLVRGLRWLGRTMRARIAGRTGSGTIDRG